MQYSTSASPLGPWTYQGVIVESGSSTTMHPSIQRFGGKWWVTYHTGDKTGGTDFRRAVCIDEVTWNGGRMNAVSHPTKAERLQPSRNVAPLCVSGRDLHRNTRLQGFRERRASAGNCCSTAEPLDELSKDATNTILRFTDLPVEWRCTCEWIEVWFDTDANALRAPASWKLQYLDADGPGRTCPIPANTAWIQARTRLMK